jgi:hypothetical protein
LAFVIVVVAGLSARKWLCGIPLIIVLEGGLALWWRVTLSRLTEGLETTKTRLTLRDYYKNMAGSMSMGILQLMQILGLLFIIAGIFLLVEGPIRYDPPRSITCVLAGVFFIGLGTMGSVAAGYMIRVKRKQ